ncbi:Nonribosomal peptide synthetase 13 [Neonectria ditissima]|uniref:Nonribosomal peptide synthetase 13 n=1 Tax=Neonectria ditissima TaxID=78410 RepID=A0A0P7AXF9_9HYPO|nr:Nonribosomal peptide synthetase 13 [Neonectria ditissima]
MSQDHLDATALADVAAACNLSPPQIDDVYACTPLQIATMAESALHSGAGVFQFVLDLSPSVNVDQFCSSLRHVVSLNAVLRTRIVDCRQGLVQVVTSEQHHTRRLAAGTDVQKYLLEDTQDALGLATPLFRSAVVGSKLVLTMHHAIMDHASLTPLFHDVLSVYHGRQPEPRAEFKEFALHCLQMDDSAAKTFWRSRFKGAPVVFPKVDAGHVSFGTHTMTRRIVLDRIGVEVSPAHVPSFIEAAWALTASSYTGSDSIAFGLVLSGRTSACPAAETTLGPTIAIVPVQVTLQKSATVEAFLKDRAAARRQLQRDPSLQYGVARIRAVSDAARIASGFQTLLNIRPRWYDPKESSEVAFDEMKEPAGPFALSVNVDLEDDGVSVHAVADPTVVPERQLDWILHQFEHHLRLLTEAPLQTKLHQVQQVSPVHLSEMVAWNSSLPKVEEGCIHELFRAQARQRPAFVAVEAWDRSATYGEIDAMSDRLAHALRQKGLSAGFLVAFIFEKSLWTVITLLGILKAGGACVPISTADPPARKAAIISGAGIGLILTSSAEYKSSVDLAPVVMEVSARSMSELPEDTDPAETKEMNDTTALAFVIFTSGSTGTPKGVMLEHRNLTSSLTQLIQRLGAQPGNRMLQFASYVWDAHLGETFVALLSGGCLCIPSEDDRKSRLAHCINHNRIDCVWLTPSVIRTLSPEDVPGLSMLCSIGEAVAPDAASTWGRSLRLINGWGPAEGSVLSSTAELTPNSHYPETIGYPITSALWIANPKNSDELVPIGAIGEILIDGPSVARGYLKDETKTKASFIKPPPWALLLNKNTQRRLYRTGDLARYNPDGSICFLARRDYQVKIRGQRLELGELESVLGSCDHVRDVLATTKIVDGRTHLVTVVTLSDSRLPSREILQEVPAEHRDTVVGHLAAIRDYARSNLPPYMVPTIWLSVQQMPLTASAKLDRDAVAQWLKDSGRLSSAKAAMDAPMTETLTQPQTKEEQLLQSIWESVLGVPQDRIGRESCFISLGGDSILAMQAASQCLRRGLAITTAALLKNTTLASVAEAAGLKLQSEHTLDAVSELKLQDKSMESPASAAILSRLDLLDIQSLRRDNVEAVVPATDGQATMLAVGETGGRGYYIDFTLRCNPSLDAVRLRNACEQVVKHHGILRTVFVAHGPNLYQVVLKSPPPNMVVDETIEGDTPTLSFRQGHPLVCFHLVSDGDGGCQSLCLEIHHTLYDAISLGLIFRDLNAAYTATSLPKGLQFHAWTSHVDSLNLSQSRHFWSDVLKDSSMPYLVSSPVGAVRGHPLDAQFEARIPLSHMAAVPSATPSTIVKAAWALLLSQATDTKDVVFGEVSANRYLPLPMMDQVQGPCVNLVPVRARLEPSMTLATLVAQIQHLHTAGMPHHHLGTRSIIKECTAWPRWTRFSTAVVYQNHASLRKTVSIGDTDCELSVQGQLGDSTDIHVIATPDPDRDELEIALRYSSLTFSDKQIQWISQTFVKILHLFPSALEQNLGQVEAILGTIPDLSYPTGPTSPAPSEYSQHVSLKAREAVSRAWAELELVPASGNKDEDHSMWDSGADIVTTLLLSEKYQSYGYDTSCKEIIENPSQKLQITLLDRKNMDPNGKMLAD